MSEKQVTYPFVKIPTAIMTARRKVTTEEDVREYLSIVKPKSPQDEAVIWAKIDQKIFTEYGPKYSSLENKTLEYHYNQRLDFMLNGERPKKPTKPIQKKTRVTTCRKTILPYGIMTIIVIPYMVLCAAFGFTAIVGGITQIGKRDIGVIGLLVFFGICAIVSFIDMLPKVVAKKEVCKKEEYLLDEEEYAKEIIKYEQALQNHEQALQNYTSPEVEYKLKNEEYSNKIKENFKFAEKSIYESNLCAKTTTIRTQKPAQRGAIAPLRDLTN